ncbi:MAG: hypothetical protein ACXABY_11015 [Candidatus Thorarchaeota archaeon]|jgi:hypothetical protein
MTDDLTDAATIATQLSIAYVDTRHKVHKMAEEGTLRGDSALFNGFATLVDNTADMTVESLHITTQCDLIALLQTVAEFTAENNRKLLQAMKGKDHTLTDADMD